MAEPIPAVPFQCMPSFKLEVARTLIRKTSSGLSMAGSSFVLYIIISKYRKNPKLIDPYQRIMFGLCVYDMLFSFFWWFMGSWMTPEGTGWWGAVGNTQTCTMQGAFTDFSLIGIWAYQTLLSCFMLLMIWKGWKPRDFEQKIEKRLHPIILACATLYMIPPLSLEGYNPECGHCVPVPLPIWCGDWIFGNGSECMRGSATLSYVYWVIFFILLPAVTIFCTGAMYIVYASVRKTERRTSMYNYSNDQFKESNRIRKTMLLYTASFYLCWILPMFFQWIPHNIPALHLTADALMPLQGLFNMLVFIQPKCVKYQRSHPGTNLFVAYIYTMFPWFRKCTKRAGSAASKRFTYRKSSVQSRATVAMGRDTAPATTFAEAMQAEAKAAEGFEEESVSSTARSRPGLDVDPDGISFRNFNSVRVLDLEKINDDWNDNPEKKPEQAPKSSFNLIAEGSEEEKVEEELELGDIDVGALDIDDIDLDVGDIDVGALNIDDIDLDVDIDDAVLMNSDDDDEVAADASNYKRQVTFEG